MAVVSLIFPSAAPAALRFTGVNLSGAEFGQAIPGVYGTDYTYPNQTEVDYFQSRGMNIVRLKLSRVGSMKASGSIVSSGLDGGSMRSAGPDNYCAERWPPLYGCGGP